jgi:hypothetical protein
MMVPMTDEVSTRRIGQLVPALAWNDLGTGDPGLKQVIEIGQGWEFGEMVIFDKRHGS